MVSASDPNNIAYSYLSSTYTNRSSQGRYFHPIPSLYFFSQPTLTTTVSFYSLYDQPSSESNEFMANEPLRGSCCRGAPNDNVAAIESTRAAMEATGMKQSYRPSSHEYIRYANYIVIMKDSECSHEFYILCVVCDMATDTGSCMKT